MKIESTIKKIQIDHICPYVKIKTNYQISKI